MTTAAHTGTDPCRICGAPVYSAGLPVCCRHITDELGITYRQLDSWVRRGYLRPERKTVRGGKYHDGSGAPRRWPATELEVARRMGRLVAAGLRPERAAGFARNSWPAGDLAPGLRLLCDENTMDDTADSRAGLCAGFRSPTLAEPAGVPSPPTVEGTPAQPLNGAVRALTGRRSAWQQADTARRAAQYGDGARRRRAAVQPGYRAGGNRRLPPGGGAA